MSDALSPDTTAAGRSVSGWLKGLLSTTFAFGGSWGGAISYWRTSDRMPGNWELMLLLVGLPVFVLLTFWLSRKLLATRDASPSPTVLANQRSAAAPASNLAGLAILAASLRLPHGTSAEELAAALAGKKARPDLDPELLDKDGFPVMTARSSDAVDDALQEEITEWLERNGMSSLDFSDEQWRALTLATAVTEELASYAERNFRPLPDSATKLQLTPILPPEWTTEHRRLAGAWLKQTATRSGWPDEAIFLDEEVLANADVATPSAIFGRLSRDAAAVDPALVAIVVACASNIGDKTVGKWAANGALFTSAHSKDEIPGEGAAGLLIGDLRQARATRGEKCVVLDGMNEGRLDSSADEVKRIDSKLVQDLTERVLKPSAVDFANIAKIIGDTDHRSSRMLELMSFTASKMPQLDEAEDVVQVGVSTGACGDVPFIAALALAHHHALELRAPALAISNRDAYRRIASLVRPVGSPDNS